MRRMARISSSLPDTAICLSALAIDADLQVGLATEVPFGAPVRSSRCDVGVRAMARP